MYIAGPEAHQASLDALWPTFRDVPAGWREVGVRGAKAACLEYIESVWTDMRPASLRRHMDAAPTTR